MQPNWSLSCLGTSQQALIPEKSPLLFLLPRMFFHHKVICLQVFTGKSPPQQGLSGPLNLKFHPMFPRPVLVIVISLQRFFFLDWVCVTTQHNVLLIYVVYCLSLHQLINSVKTGILFPICFVHCCFPNACHIIGTQCIFLKYCWSSFRHNWNYKLSTQKNSHNVFCL